MTIDHERMEHVVGRALIKVAGDMAWSGAITRAARELEWNPYIHWDGDTLLVLSDSNELYTVGKGCRCKSSQWKKPCWHRALARLLLRYDEASSVLATGGADGSVTRD
ncbi:MAG: hypothetical protein H0T60_08055 [Acidobacteria bacterium]|nr:hypothetical protein [Acidobacteriota bacterium]